MSTLQEIVAEGRKLHAEHDAATMWRSLKTAELLNRFYVNHGPRLLAAVEAAVEMRRTYGRLESLHAVEPGIPTWAEDADGELVQTGRTPDTDKPDCAHCRTLAAFDAASLGQEKK